MTINPPTPFLLPNGVEVFHYNKYETLFLYNEIFVERTYLKNGITLSPNSCVVDVGANIGMFALFIELNSEAPRIYSFEPSPSTCAAFRKNVGKHGGCVKLFEQGISDHNGILTFSSYPNYSLLSGFHSCVESDAETLADGIRDELKKTFPGGREFPEAHIQKLASTKLGSPKRMECRVSTLSSILESESCATIDLLKIDVEKAELSVLAGISDFHWQCIQQIVIETHSRSTRHDIDALLADRGYRVESVISENIGGGEIATLYGLRCR